MFQKYRKLFLLIALLFFVQLLYSNIKFQIKKNECDRELKYDFNNTTRQIILFNKSAPVETTSLVFNQTIVSNVNARLQLASAKNGIAGSVRKNFNIVESFINASFIDTPKFSVPDPDKYLKLPQCKPPSFVNDSLLYRVNISIQTNAYNEIECKHGMDINAGGHWYPAGCQTKQRTAIIVCYRQRENHLKMFLNHMHPFLKSQQLDYTIIIVNQHGNESFNRGALFNVGYIEAMKFYPFTCFIFHDVDLLPEDLRNVYHCGLRPKHMSVAVDKFNYKLLYPTLFGGVTAFSIDDFIRSNGYPNVYWGWGNEDDDMYFRVVRKLKKDIARYPIEIARYKMIRTHGHKSGGRNPYKDKILHSKYDYGIDGINTIRYQLHHITLYHLFTFINVTLFEESYEQICDRLKIPKKT